MIKKLFIFLFLLGGTFTLSADMHDSDKGEHRFQNLTEEQREELKNKKEEIKEMRMKMMEDRRGNSIHQNDGE